MIYIDTHVAIFLYLGDLSLLSKKAIAFSEKEELILCAMAELELEYLYEIGKLQVRPEAVVKVLQKDLGLKRCELSCHEIIQKARTLTWTRDPFDRMIVGSAMAAKKHLLTKDRNILKHSKIAVW